MPVFDTTNFARISYEEDAVLEFPRGLPGFEARRRFLALSLPPDEPLVFLQSLEDPALCFIALPVLAADPSYRLTVDPEDLALIGMPPNAPARIGKDVLCLAVVSLREDGPTANLLAPIVVNLRNRRAVQAVAPQSGYSHRHPLLPPDPKSPAAPAAEAVACS